MNITQQTFTATLLAVLASFAVSSANADEPRLTAKVSYADLNLESTAGTNALLSRLHRAAIIVCKPLDNRSVSAKRLFDSCVEHAVSEAVADINRPSVSTRFAQLRSAP